MFDRESDAATETGDDERLRRRMIGCEAKSESDPESSSEIKSFVFKGLETVAILQLWFKMG